MEPWNLRIDDSRSANSLKTFVIFCEGEVSEPIYFEFFETSLIKVNAVRGVNSKLQHVQKAMEHCFEQQHMFYENGKAVFAADNIDFWCVFDRDMDMADPSKELGINIAFDNSLKIATDDGFKVGWSNDSFELWILLHFEDVYPELDLSAFRTYYYERLTMVFKNLAGTNPELEAVRNREGFNYKQHMKGRNNFLNIVRKEMLPRTQQAIERAEKLLDHHNKVPAPAHQMAPCTQVHKLVLELLAEGGKVLPN